MTYVALVPLDQLDRKLVQLVEVVARIRDLPRLVAKPAHRLQDALKVAALLRLRVRVVEAQVTSPAVVRRVPEVDEDSLRVPDVQEAVRLGREPRVYEPARRGEVLLAQVRVDLRVLADFVEAPEEPLREDGFG